MNVLSLIEDLVLQILITLTKSDSSYYVKNSVEFRKRFNFCSPGVHGHAQMALFLSVVYKAIKNQTIITKRSIYYENPKIFCDQCVIEKLMSHVCERLNINRFSLNTVATSKSIVYGDAWVHNKSDIFLSLKTSKEGVTLPCSNIDIDDVSCSALFVLVIEKDATFQKIMLSDFYDDFQPCLLITSKGYPDLATRSFLSKLCQKYPKLPMYALVDADPHGIGIYLIYKYGSKNPSLKTDSGAVLSVPNLKLLGILPSDLSMLQIKQHDLLQLSDADISLLRGMKERYYYNIEKKLQPEIAVLEVTQKKAEIQCLENLGATFLCSEYLPRKLQQEGILPITNHRR